MNRCIPILFTGCVLVSENYGNLKYTGSTILGASSCPEKKLSLISTFPSILLFKCPYAIIFNLLSFLKKNWQCSGLVWGSMLGWYQIWGDASIFHWPFPGWTDDRTGAMAGMNFSRNGAHKTEKPTMPWDGRTNSMLWNRVVWSNLIRTEATTHLPLLNTPFSIT